MTTMHDRMRTAITTVVVALAIGLAVAASQSGDRHPVVIGSAIQSHDASRSAAAQHAEHVPYDDLDLELVAAYLVHDGQLIDAAGAPSHHLDTWAQVERTLPADAVKKISQLNIITDGPHGTLAMVHRSGIDDDRWILSIDVAESTEVLTTTLVHEYAHMLTLRAPDLSTEPDVCDGVALTIGCASPGSTLALWAERFWPGVTEPATPDSSQFVSEYAASSVHEDLAETFLTYVAGDLATLTPAIEAKLTFFDAFPELVEGAAAIRANIAS